MFMCDCHQVGVLVYERYHILPIYMILMSLHLGYLHELTYRSVYIRVLSFQLRPPIGVLREVTYVRRNFDI